jgi:hypothetical protein
MAGGALAAVAAIVAAVWIARDGDDAPAAPAPSPSPSSLPAPPDDGEALARDMLHLFGRALDLGEKQPGSLTPTPTTAQGWLELAKTQPPADALVSVRQALELQPGWRAAEEQLCALLTLLGDPAAAAPPCGS